MDVGIPCSRTMSVKNARATYVGVYGCPKAMKWAYFENLSTTVRITLLPFTLGSPSTKSIAMSAQTCDGTSRGWSRPAGCSAFVLFF